jgi:hypothetical protein
VFLQAVNTVLDMSLITTLNVVVTVNGIITQSMQERALSAVIHSATGISHLMA